MTIKTFFRTSFLTIFALVLVSTIAFTSISKAQTAIVKRLNVPYINQCLQKDNKTLWPNMIGNTPNRQICRNMCLTSAIVMVAGYYGKLNYDTNNTDTLKKYLIEDPSIPEKVKDGNTMIGGAFAVTSYTGTNGNNDDNHAEGLINYSNRKGIIASDIMWIPQNPNTAIDFIYSKAKAAIDRNNVLIISTPTHARVVIGYTNDKKILVHDSYRNTELGSSGDYFNMNGQGAIYDLPTSGTGRPAIPVEQFQYMIEFASNDTSFYGGKEPYVDGMPKMLVNRIGSNVRVTNTTPSNGWSSINIRKNVADKIIGEIPFGITGKVVSKPIYSKGYFREEVEFNNGQKGWIASPFIVIDGVGGGPVQNNIVYTNEELNLRSSPNRSNNIISSLPANLRGFKQDNQPVIKDGYTWIYVKWDNGKEGWSASEFIR
jgi:hypothetical protein